MANQTNSRRVFILLSVVVAVSLPIISFDFGITEDEQLHNEHGKSVLDYFLGKRIRSISALFPIPATMLEVR